MKAESDWRIYTFTIRNCRTSPSGAVKDLPGEEMLYALIVIDRSSKVLPQILASMLYTHVLAPVLVLTALLNLAPEQPPGVNVITMP